MKVYRRIAGITLIACSAVATAVAHAVDLEVTLLGVAEATGRVRVAVYDGPAAYENRTRWAGIDLPARAAPLAFVIRDIPPGRYAVSAFHDRNADQVLNKNLFGKPSEPYGFSNGAGGVLGPPGFDDIAFTVSNETVSVVVTLSD